MSSHSVRRNTTTIITRVLERLEGKCCPQGLHVIVEELQWMGERSITYEKVLSAVRAEMRRDHPRIRRVAEGVYWFTDAEIPLGWSLYRDLRMLPCFYRSIHHTYRGTTLIFRKTSFRFHASLSL